MRDIPNNLPFQNTPFVGRTKELAEIARLLGDPVCRLLSLVGPGGIGKTRLALEAATRHLEAYPDGVYFVPLAALSSPDYIVAATAEVFCCKINQGGDALQQLLNHLREKQALLVMDNFEHLLEGAEVVSHMLAQAPALKIIVTSREALNLQEEWLRPVIGMGFPDVAARDAADLRLEDYSAVQMFVQHARRMRADFSLEKERAGVIEICALVEGMPLALELAATWVRVLSCDEIAREIRRSLDFLETRARNVQPRHRSMRVVLDQSWGRLERAEQAVFERLTVFRGGFTRDAAHAVAGADLPVLSALTDKSLLRRDAAGRYDLHELVRQYGEEQLNSSPEGSAQVRSLHCAYYMTFLQERWPKMLGSKPKEAMQEIEQEIKNIRAAWRWAVDHRLEMEIEKGLDSLWFFYDTRSWYREGHKAFARAADALRDSPPENSLILGRVLARQGVLCGSLNWITEATALLQEGLVIFRRLDNRQEIAFALARLGAVAWYIEHYEEARQYFNDSLVMYEAIGDRWEQAYVLNRLGYLTRDVSQQLALHKRCLAIFQELDSRWGIAVATISLGQSALDMGDYGEALRLGQIGFGLSQEIDIQWNVILALQLLGGIAFKTGKHLEAKWCFEQALQIGLDVQLIRFVRHASTGMARVLGVMGHKAQAIELYAAALRYAEQSAAQLHLERIEAELSPEDFAAVLERSKEIEPESAIRTLLADLERLDEEGEDEDEAAGPLPVSTQPSIDSLTERELEILRLVAEGKSNRDIAAELVLALGTVKWYISQIFSKLGAASRTQAVARARELSLLQ